LCAAHPQLSVGLLLMILPPLRTDAV
jgi:hypothetical protein